MSSEINLTTKVCRLDNQNSCNDVILKVSKDEITKFQTLVHSNSPDLGQFNMNYLMSGMGIVLFCYVFSYGIGQIIKQFR
ncbi:hypothetical protein [Mannheimia bovis]|uniref:Uncharacterized protein n=1 Tax=Mannheimia bovis TaxID=2770636 RepID=A0A7H1C113_9PAST|nr:hypothetical protein [Mannheimia bovis]QNS14668.1 hypothetical protein ICJ55_07890 [Mannheimia bovis]